MQKPLYICGPTASGKTALSIALARELDGEVINADAYQIYRGLEHLSAAPTPAEKAQVPHHLFSHIPVSENCDAMRYRTLALEVISDVQSRGKVPIVTGGSGLYLKFLTHGVSPVPPSDPKLRAELETLSDQELIEQLTHLDPEGAAITNLQNRRYVIRALEICRLSGAKMSVLKSDWAKRSQETEKNLRGLFINWPRQDIRDRITRRTEELVSPATLAEVADAAPIASETASKAIGFQDLLSLQSGEIPEAQAIQNITTATHQYAKRQSTWFRKEIWLTPIEPPATASQALSLLPSLQNN